MDFEHGDFKMTVSKKRIRMTDLVVANSFLDVVDLPEVLEEIFSVLRPNGLFYLTLNFDGFTSFYPVIDPKLDVLIIERYHARMDSKGADMLTHRRSHTGRELIRWLGKMNVRLLDVGCSDWVVLPMGNDYTEDERLFLHSIIGMVESELWNDDEIGRGHLNAWVERRREQINAGELIYIAHQMDVVGAVND